MPELPEVQTVLYGLADKLKDKRITALDCYYDGTVILDPELDQPVFPARVVSFQRRGKYMILHLDGGACLIIHLRMTGKLVHSEERTAPGKHERACFALADGGTLQFIDPRTFGKITVCKAQNLSQYLPKLGAEPLDDEFDPVYLSARFKGRKLPVKNALLDQRVVAGLGNIYVSEILFRAKVRPERPAGQISGPEIKAIVRETKAVLREAIAKNGTSISDFRRVDDKTGEFQNFLRVYQKKQCPRGHDLETVRLGGRSSFYCPLCQK